MLLLIGIKVIYGKGIFYDWNEKEDIDIRFCNGNIFRRSRSRMLYIFFMKAGTLIISPECEILL